MGLISMTVMKRKKKTEGSAHLNEFVQIMEKNGKQVHGQTCLAFAVKAVKLR